MPENHRPIVAGFCYPLMGKERVIRPELGGGGLLDIGIYPLTLADMIIGYEGCGVSSEAVLTGTGMGWSMGRMAI